MDFFLLGGETEDHPAYQQLAAANTLRHYHFMNSMISAAITTGRPLLSQSLIKALNFHAIVGLHYSAGEYRSQVVRVGDYVAPPHFYVEPLMDDFVNEINLMWQATQGVQLAAHALWRINAIHPFVNGNGRTARAICYFVLCVKLGRLLPGRTILPQRLREPPIRERYVSSLKAADSGDLSPLIRLIREETVKQVTET